MTRVSNPAVRPHRAAGGSEARVTCVLRRPASSVSKPRARTRSWVARVRRRLADATRCRRRSGPLLACKVCRASDLMPPAHVDPAKGQQSEGCADVRPATRQAARGWNASGPAPPGHGPAAAAGAVDGGGGQAGAVGGPAAARLTSPKSGRGRGPDGLEPGHDARGPVRRGPGGRGGAVPDPPPARGPRPMGSRGPPRPRRGRPIDRILQPEAPFAPSTSHGCVALRPPSAAFTWPSPAGRGKAAAGRRPRGPVRRSCRRRRPAGSEAAGRSSAGPGPSSPGGR